MNITKHFFHERYQTYIKEESSFATKVLTIILPLSL